jgi:very-short-patch-repair endonuclease
MPKKLTTEEFIERSKKIHGDKYDYSQVTYINNSTPVKIIYGGVAYEQLPQNHLKGFKCENNKKMTEDDFIRKSKEIHGDKYDYSLVGFKNVRSKIKLIYNDVIYEQIGYAHLQGKSPEMLSIKITDDEFIRRSKEINGDIFDYSLVDCDGNKNKVKLIYNGVIYDQCLSDHLSGHLPMNINIINNSSKGEKSVMKFLENNNIKYIREYKFQDCKNINYLRFDFYLPDYNLLIEYDGKQHFNSINIWGGLEGLKKRKLNDEIKNKYCKKNGIPLLRISHLEDVDSKLNEFLVKHYT